MLGCESAELGAAGLSPSGPIVGELGTPTWRAVAMFRARAPSASLVGLPRLHLHSPFPAGVQGEGSPSATPPGLGPGHQPALPSPGGLGQKGRSCPPASTPRSAHATGRARVPLAGAAVGDGAHASVSPTRWPSVGTPSSGSLHWASRHPQLPHGHEGPCPGGGSEQRALESGSRTPSVPAPPIATSHPYQPEAPATRTAHPHPTARLPLPTFLTQETIQSLRPATGSQYSICRSPGGSLTKGARPGSVLAPLASATANKSHMHRTHTVPWMGLRAHLCLVLTYSLLFPSLT